MQYTLVLLLIIVAIQLSVAPPVTKDKKDEDDKENEIEEQDEMAAITEYHRYLKEVVQVLESDPDFRAKLEKADEDDIRTGKIARELQFVSHKVRFQLDELKRKELERLRHLAAKENELVNGLDYNHLKIAEHLDHANPRTFEIEDLKKLIAKTTQDLAEADRRRREEFKEYEMQKKFEEEQKLKAMSEDERKSYEEELRVLKEKHKKHQPLHHPGSKQQLEEVWEKQDQMDSQEFDPKTFFHLHDVDSNGLWDQDEVKALFLKELNKLYAEGAPEDDLYERAEEMERMREHVFNEADTNRDGFIDFNEFLEQTKKPDFQQDEGWQTIDEQQIYSQQEYEAFEKRRQEELQKMIAKGMFPSQYGNVPPPQGMPQQGYVPPAPPAGHPNQVPVQQQYQGQAQQQYHQPQAASHQQYQGQVPPQQQIPNQMGQQQQVHGQFAQQQQYQGQIPQQQQQQQQQHHQQQQQQQQQHQQQQQFQGQVPQQGQPHGQPQQQQPNFQQQNNVGQVPVPQAQQNPQAASMQQQASANSVPQAVKV